MTSATWVPQWGSAMPTQPPSPLPSLTETYNTLRLENGVEEVLVEGRQKFPLYKKLNLVWWFLNEYESTPPDWYHPGQNFLLRLTSWYLRNPFQNASNYVFGVCDRNFTVRGLAPVMWTTYDDLDPPRTGTGIRNQPRLIIDHFKARDSRRDAHRIDLHEPLAQPGGAFCAKCPYSFGAFSNTACCQ